MTRTTIAAGALILALVMAAAGLFGGIAWENHRNEQNSHEPKPVDIGFAQDMSIHHDQAILLSNTLSRDVAPEIVGIADRIAATQAAEAATMRGWLDWFGLPPTSDDPMSWMHPSEHDHGSSTAVDDDEPPMPGMASVDEIGRLSDSRGTAAEVLFLQLMVRHHRGGVEMATAAQNSDTASGATKRLALAMITEQGDEIGQMTLLLRARGATA